MTGRRFFLTVGLVTYVILDVLFALVGVFTTPRAAHDLTTAWDLKIPLVPQFIWAYMVFWAFPFVPFLVVRDWHRFNRFVISGILVSVTAWATYLAWPVVVYRPELGNGLSERLLSAVYRFDDIRTGANNFPSLHVACAWLVVACCRRQGLSRPVEGSITLVAAAITASTVLARFHVLLDVGAGLLWAWGSWIAAGAIYTRWAPSGAGPEDALRAVGSRAWGAVSGWPGRRVRQPRAEEPQP
jgi:hypothetical protein